MHSLDEQNTASSSSSEEFDTTFPFHALQMIQMTVAMSSAVHRNMQVVVTSATCRVLVCKRQPM